MNDESWIICYYCPDTKRLVTLRFMMLDNALDIVKELLYKYGDNLDYKIFKGDIWL